LWIKFTTELFTAEILDQGQSIVKEIIQR